MHFVSNGIINPVPAPLVDSPMRAAPADPAARGQAAGVRPVMAVTDRRGPRRFPSPEELPDARSAISRRARRRARSGGGVMDVVVVESPAKARTIGTWLGKGYRVMATRGHVRDLPSKAGSVKPDEDFAMVYETGKRAARTLGAVAKALEKAESLILATDPDREGEAIAWQVLSWLEERDAIGGRPVRRVVFHEITPAAVRAALAQPRGIDMDLVRAWQARRALDYLVGYGLSPVLWRKLPRCRSAGRVQSVALRLVCEREAGIEAFVAREYWTVEAVASAGDARFEVALTRLDGAAVGDAGLATAGTAEDAARRIRDVAFTVASAERDTRPRPPPPPFTTAALQQEASRRLGFTTGVNGVPSVDNDSTQLSDDATLSELIFSVRNFSEAALEAVDLSPAFDPGIEMYSASVSVAFSKKQVTFMTAVNHAGATVAYFDEDDMALEDANTSTSDLAEGHQVEPAVGPNTVKVKVTAPDGTTEKTYTVTVTRDRPTLSGSGAQVNGTTVLLQFESDLPSGTGTLSAAAVAAFTVTADGVERQITGIALWVQDNFLDVTLSTPIYQGQAVVVSYDSAAAGGAALVDREGTEYLPDGSGRALGRRDRDGKLLHRPGRDVTLSAPKSVSLAALVGGDVRVVDAHDRAVQATLAWIEKNAVATRLWDPATGQMVP